jgi:hypothetical protein
MRLDPDGQQLTGIGVDGGNLTWRGRLDRLNCASVDPAIAGSPQQAVADVVHG